MRKDADLSLLSFIDDTLFCIEYAVKDNQKVSELIKECRIKMYRYRTTRNKTTPKTINKHKLITMLYSEDIERLHNAGFTDTQIATITGVELVTIKKYLIERKLS